MILAACNLQTFSLKVYWFSDDDDDDDDDADDDADADSLNHSSNSSVASDMVDSIDPANELSVIVYSAKVVVSFYLSSFVVKVTPTNTRKSKNWEMVGWNLHT